MTVGEWLRHAEGRLAAVESPRLEAQLLAGHVLLVERSWLLAHPEAEFPELAGEGLLQRREGQEPLAYILGRREFYGREFRVRPGVLIPRQDTEILLEAALEATDAKRALDIGAGSGILAISLKLERPAMDVTGVDVSPQALEIAAENAEALGADIRLLRSDGFSELEGVKFDLIVSNPPYIADSEELMGEVRQYEPAQALFSGPTGLEFYERLARESGEYLAPGGRLLLEVGHTQAAAVRALFEAEGWRWRETRKDLSGIERVVAFEPA
jgi:release factor glutamine methyltransferase